MKKKLSFWGNIAVFTLCVALVIAASFYALSVRQLNVVYTPADSKESTADITNPFCGFYKINGYVLAEDKTARDADIWCQRSCKDTTYPLMLLEINLRNYAENHNQSLLTYKELRMDIDGFHVYQSGKYDGQGVFHEFTQESVDAMGRCSPIIRNQEKDTGILKVQFNVRYILFYCQNLLRLKLLLF